MATARLPRPQLVRFPAALFSYFVLTWTPITISGLLFWAWNLATGDTLPVWGLVIFLLLFRQLNVFTISTLFHRSYSHRQFVYHPWVEAPMRVWNWLWMGTGGRAWAILHRWHHAAADTAEDPHSPTKPGGSLWNITQQTAKSYQHCLRNPELFTKYEHHLPDDRFEHFVRWLERRGFFGLVLVRIPLLVGVLCAFPGIDLPAAVLSLPGIMGSVWFSTVIMVNGLCHTMGYRIWDNAETSTNLFPVDFFGWGEALHHNHHERQGRANLAHEKWEFDSGFWALWLLSKVGVVRELRP
jgi:stearoyl-CoA desaturase (delta-9 desaturase)